MQPRVRWPRAMLFVHLLQQFPASPLGPQFDLGGLVDHLDAIAGLEGIDTGGLGHVANRSCLIESRSKSKRTARLVVVD